MMVPRMQGDIIETVRGVLPQVNSCLDPFVGSGTTLVEALKQGLIARGFDVNPMAILLCQVKTAPFNPAGVSEAVDNIFVSASADTSKEIVLQYDNREKWFTKTASTLR